MASIPPQPRSKSLRACLLCSLIQTPADWKKLGCPNCESILELKQSPEQIGTCTTTQFEGIIAIIDPDQSWVGRWQRIAKYARGMYAARVKGRLHEDIEAKLEENNVKYRPRESMDLD